MSIKELVLDVEGSPCDVALRVRAEEIVKFRHVVGRDWLEYIYNVSIILSGY